MKKSFMGWLALLMAATLCIGCAVAEEAPLKGNLIVTTNASGATFDAVTQVVNNFMAENPGVTIEYSTQTSDYENLMKAKMAANDLPDVFATHGWSVNRYSEYLLPLNDQSWAGEILETLVPVLDNDKGEIFVLPINRDQGGLVYHKGILKELGKDVPKTFAEFLDCCEAAKQAGYTPVFIAGKDDRNAANLLDISATTFLISNEQKNYRHSLKDGSFDWSNWDQVAGFLTELKEKGYLNVDCATADPIVRAEKFANKEVLFMFQNNAMCTEVWGINPDAEIGMMPVPTLTAEDEPVLIGGEREAYGVWKDSPNKELALALLSYMAKPENIKLVCEASSMAPGLKGIDVDLGKLTEDYNTYATLRTFPYFDREYLPSGMWSILRSTGGALTAGEATPQEASAIMKENYDKLRSQQ